MRLKIETRRFGMMTRSSMFPYERRDIIKVNCLERRHKLMPLKTPPHLLAEVFSVKFRGTSLSMCLCDLCCLDHVNLES